MKTYKTLYFLILVVVVSCSQSPKDDYLLSFTDKEQTEYGYKNQQGEIVIELGKYDICFTDTFRTYAFVAKKEKGFIAIDRNEKELYQVFNYDNGPDYYANGLFRIVVNNKIGYADSATGKIIIQPKYEYALPFENGRARVSLKCKKTLDDEHTRWESNEWFEIDMKGEKLK